MYSAKINSCGQTDDSCSKSGKPGNIAVFLGFFLVLAVLIWQAITAEGNPNPESPHISSLAALVNTGILVFREGLEAVLVLAALAASLVRGRQCYWKPIAIGSAASFVATIPTWVLVVAILSSISAPALDIQAGTGLLAIIVLLVIMNWFFHSVYWGGWISMHNRRKKDLIECSDRSNKKVFWGLVLLGFTSVYREGFEIVLFLQSLRLRVGEQIVYEGAIVGLILTGIVAYITFVAHRRLPYKKMLVFTGIMLGGVLLVMVGESIQEMQQADWISTTALNIPIPAWMNVWFAVFPTAESLCSQFGAGLLVAGSYFLARSRVGRTSQPSVVKPRPQHTMESAVTA